MKRSHESGSDDGGDDGCEDPVEAMQRQEAEFHQVIDTFDVSRLQAHTNACTR